MAFEGDLSNLQLGDIFQTLAMTRQTGTFVVRGHEERRIAFSEKGIALLSARPSLGRWVGRHLFGTGRIEEPALVEALEAVRRRPDEFVGDALLAAEACTEDDLRRSKRYVAAEEIYELFGWSDGHFEFLAGEHESGGAFADVWFDVGSIAMEAARRLDERRLLDSEVPEQALLIPASELVPEDLSEDERAVLASLDGTRTLERLAEDHHLGAFDILRAVHGLLRRGLVRAAELHEIVDRAAAAAEAKRYDKAARLYEVACGMAPHDQSLRENVAAALTKAGEKRAAAVHLIHAGYVRIAEEDHVGAQDVFKRALRLDNGNPDAHAGLMRAHLSLGEVAKGIAAARAAASRWVSLGDHRAAISVARDGLDHSPGDVPLRMALANAQIGFGDQVGALATLDELATLLENTGGDQRKRLEVYRSILQLDPERREIARKIEILQEADRARRKRVARLAGIAAGALLLAGLAVPMMSGPSVEARFEEANALIAAGDTDGARAIVDALRLEDLDDDMAIQLNNLSVSLERPRDEGGGPEVEAIGRRLSGLYAQASSSMQEQNFEIALAELEQAGALLDAPETKRHQARAGKALAELRKEARREIKLALEMMARDLDQVSGKLTGLSETYTEETFRKDEPVSLEKLVTSAATAAELTDQLDWTELPKRVDALTTSLELQSPELLTRIAAGAERIVESSARIEEGGARARALLRKHELKNGFYAVRRSGQLLTHEGRLEQAQTQFEQFLEQCNELRHAGPDELYESIRTELLEGLDLDGRIEERLTTLHRILAREKSADSALAAGDMASAYRIRATLVTDHPTIDFEKRFRLPVRLVTYPAGATVVLIDETSGERELGRTPLTVECRLVEDTLFSIRRPGFEDHLLERKGASDSRGGRAEIELVKRTEWRTGAAGTTEASAVVTRDRALVADRTGRVRALSLTDGSEAALFETQLLGGVAGGVAVVGEYVHVPTLDGVCFVLELDTLAERSRYLLDGPGRAAPLALDGSVVLADDSGVLRRVDATGSELWRQNVGRIRSAPVAVGGRLHMINSDAELVVVHAGTGNVARRQKLGTHPVWTRPLVVDGSLVCASRDGTLLRVHPTSGEIEWTHDLEVPIDARPCTTGGRLMAVTSDGAVLVLDPTTGELLDRRLIGARVEADLVPHDDGFLVTTVSGRLHDLDRSGRPNWVFDVGETVTATPTLTEGRVLVVTRSGAAVLLAR